MTDDQILEVVQAHKEGKQIQCSKRISIPVWGTGPDGNWSDCGVLGSTIIWNFIEYDYRVKPEPRKPREWWIKMGTHGYGGMPDVITSMRPHSDIHTEDYIHVREVIEKPFDANKIPTEIYCS